MMRLRNTLILVLGLAVILTVPALADDEPVPVPTGPMNVEQAVEIALQQNYAFLQSIAEIGVAEGSRLNSLAAMLPAVSGSYSYTDNDNTTTLKDLETVTLVTYDLPVNNPAAMPIGSEVLARGDVPLDSRAKTNAWGVNVRADFSLSRWFNYRSAHAGVQGARWGMQAAAQQLAFEVRQQFYLTLRAQDLLTVQEEDLRLARDEERRINSMFELGSVARVDVLKAKVRVSDAEVALISQRNTVEIEKTRLATLLGFRADTSLELGGNLSDEIAPVDSVTAAKDAMTRPSVLQAQENLRSANNQYKSAAWSRIPGLFASFDWGSSAGSTISDNLTQDALPGVPDSFSVTTNLRAFQTDSDRESDGWTFRVGAQLQLDAFVNMGQHKRAHNIKRQAAYALEGQELEVQRELEEAILNLRASRSAIEAAKSGVESAEEDLRLSQERYQQGLGTILELLESQVALTRARNTMVNALTGLKISEAALDKARGAPLPYLEEAD